MSKEVIGIEDRYRSIKKASILGIIGNVFLFVIKAIIGFMAKSQAMIADSANSAGDIFSSLMTGIGNKIASRPSDETHNLGHGKAEYIFSMLISISMIVVSIELLKNSITSIINHSKYEFSWLLVIVCVVTIIVKFCLFLYTYQLSKKYKNLLIEANAKDHRNDCFVTMFTLMATALSHKGVFWLDGVVGIGISIWIAITGSKIFIESFHVLMDKSMNEESKQRILDLIKQHPEISKIQHFNSTPIGYQYQISLTIYVDGNLSTFESHDIANRLEKEICENIEEIYLAVIHVNPM